jgi:acyl-homoserine lactone acylase PvdQ
MDNSDRTGPGSGEIPQDLLPLLREAAEDSLERACDNGGEWNAEIRGRVLAAVDLARAFDLRTLTADVLAELADRALAWADPIFVPRTRQEVEECRRRLMVAEALVDFGARARAAADGAA